MNLVDGVGHVLAGLLMAGESPLGDGTVGQASGPEGQGLGAPGIQCGIAGTSSGWQTVNLRMRDCQPLAAGVGYHHEVIDV